MEKSKLEVPKAIKFLPAQRLIVVGFSKKGKMDVIGYAKLRKNLAKTLYTTSNFISKKDIGLQCVKK